ncbi:hypothetical protein C8J57DRAFT_1248542 [Mycena rebaudengoi]|nr:hypothetical protein C8J57DRAFT_1248542 [Mycena rebaudengoi]
MRPSSSTLVHLSLLALASAQLQIQCTPTDDDGTPNTGAQPVRSCASTRAAHDRGRVVIQRKLPVPRGYESPPLFTPLPNQNTSQLPPNNTSSKPSNTVSGSPPPSSSTAQRMGAGAGMRMGGVLALVGLVVGTVL